MDPKKTYTFLEQEQQRLSSLSEFDQHALSLFASIIAKLKQLDTSSWSALSIAKKNTPLIQHQFSQLLVLIIHHHQRDFYKEVTISYMYYLRVIQMSKPSWIVKNAAKMLLGTDFDQKKANAAKTADALALLHKKEKFELHLFNDDVTVDVSPTPEDTPSPSINRDFTLSNSEFHISHVNLSTQLLSELIKKLSQYLHAFHASSLSKGELDDAPKALTEKSFARWFHQHFHGREDDMEEFLSHDNILLHGLEYTVAMIIATKIYLEQYYADRHASHVATTVGYASTR